MACLDEIPFTIERRRILFGAGTIIDPTPICTTADNECCSDDGDPTCCDGEFTAELAATLNGPLDGSCGDEVVSLTLTWDATDERWYGEGANALETYSFRVWFACVNGVYTGTVQVLDSDGALIDESPDVVLGPTCDATPPTLDGSYAPEGDLAPCGDNVVISIDHPCPLQCGGVPAVPCCPDGFTEILSATLDPIGALTLTYNPEWGVWDGAVANGDDTFVATVWCDGESWQMALDLYTDGELVDSDYQPLAPGPDCTTLVATATVGSEPFDFETEHPCAPEPCANDPVACPGECLGAFTATVIDETGDCTCLPATLIYVGSGVGYVARWQTVTCPGNIDYELRCEAGFYTFYAGSTQCVQVAGVASPFSLTFQLPDLGANCGGAGGTAKVTITCT